MVALILPWQFLPMEGERVTIRMSRQWSGDRRVLRIAGWLEGEDADELLQLATDSVPEVVLDFTDLQSADKQGLEAIRGLVERGVAVRGLSDYLEMLLKTMSNASKTLEPEEGTN